MIYSLRRPGDYNRQRRAIQDSLNTAINNQQAFASAYSKRVQGDTSPPSTQVIDNRTAAEKRVDLTTQQEKLRKHLLEIMDPSEAGEVLRKYVTRRGTALRDITRINEQWNGIKTDIKKRYTDVSPDIFIDFADAFVAAEVTAGASTNIVAAPGPKATLIAHLMDTITTLKITLDLVTKHLYVYFDDQIRNNTSPKGYDIYEDDFKYILNLRRLIHSRSNAYLMAYFNSLNIGELRLIEPYFASFPSVQQVQHLISQYFQRSGILRPSVTFKNFMKGMASLFRLSPISYSKVGDVLGYESTGLADLERDIDQAVTGTMGIANNIDANATLQILNYDNSNFELTPDMMENGGMAIVGVGAPAVVPTLPASTPPVAPLPLPPASLMSSSAPAAAGAAGPVVTEITAESGSAPGDPAAQIHAPFIWYKPAGGWSVLGDNYSAQLSSTQYKTARDLMKKSAYISVSGVSGTPPTFTPSKKPDNITLGDMVYKFNIYYAYIAFAEQTSPFSKKYDSDTHVGLMRELEQTNEKGDFDAYMRSILKTNHTDVNDINIMLPSEWFVPCYDVSDQGSRFSWVNSNSFGSSTNLVDYIAAIYNEAGATLPVNYRTMQIDDINKNMNCDYDILNLVYNQIALAKMVDPSQSRGIEISAAVRHAINNGASIDMQMAPWDALPADHPQVIFRDQMIAIMAGADIEDADPLAAAEGEAAGAEAAESAAVVHEMQGVAPDHNAALASAGQAELESGPSDSSGTTGNVGVSEQTGSGIRMKGRKVLKNKVYIGRGVSPPHPRLIPGIGIPPVTGPKYVTFGTLYMNRGALDNNELIPKALQGGTYRTVQGFNKQRVSSDLAHVIKTLIDRNTVDYPTFIRLHQPEQVMLAKLINRAGLSCKFDTPVRDESYERFILLKNHILAGGNNPGEINEFKRLIFSFVREGRLTHHQAQDICAELVDV